MFIIYFPIIFVQSFEQLISQIANPQSQIHSCWSPIQSNGTKMGRRALHQLFCQFKVLFARWDYLQTSDSQYTALTKMLTQH